MEQEAWVLKEVMTKVKKVGHIWKNKGHGQKLKESYSHKKPSLHY